MAFNINENIRKLKDNENNKGKFYQRKIYIKKQKRNIFYVLIEYIYQKIYWKRLFFIYN